jgi:hypothetical protein
MNDVISTDLKENPKRFWAAIKSKKQESTEGLDLLAT